MRPWLALLLFAGMAAAQDQTASVSGTVVGTNGVPLRKATVILQPIVGPRPAGNASAAFSATSDGSGRFSIAGIPAGGYALSADHVGYLRASYGARDSGTGAILNLAPGDDMHDLKIQMVEQSVITGRVTDEDGDPVRNVQVRLLRRTFTNGVRQLTPAAVAQVNDIGEFRLSGITAGQYYLAAEPAPRAPAAQARKPAGPGAPPEQESILTYYPSVTDAASAVFLRLRAGEALAGITIRLAKGSSFHVSGMVTGLEGNPGQYRVSMAPPGPTAIAGQQTRNATVDRSGHFDIPGVTPGSWSIWVTHLGPGNLIMANRLIQVTGQDVEDLNLEAVPPAKIHGTVRIDSAGPASDVSTLKLSIGLSLQSAPIALQNAALQDGEFTLTTAGAGQYRVNVMGIPQDFYLKSVTMGGRNVLDIGFEVGEGGSAGEMEVVLGSPAAEIFGVLMGPDGNNVPGAIVTIVPDPLNPDRQDLYRRANTDQIGRFSFRGLAPGKYRVYGWDQLDPGEEFDPDMLNAHEDKAVAVTVSEGDRTIVTLPESVP